MRGRLTVRPVKISPGNHSTTLSDLSIRTVLCRKKRRFGGSLLPPFREPLTWCGVCKSAPQDLDPPRFTGQNIENTALSKSFRPFWPHYDFALLKNRGQGRRSKWLRNLLAEGQERNDWILLTFPFTDSVTSVGRLVVIRCPRGRHRRCRRSAI